MRRRQGAKAGAGDGEATSSADESDAHAGANRADDQRFDDWPTPRYSKIGELGHLISEFGLNTFFSCVEVVNQDNIPREGPVILYANHNNQFVDGMVMMRTAQRPVSFIAAECSFNKRVIGEFLRMLDAVPVVRPQDRAEKGPGRLVSIDLDRRILKGEGTKFKDIPAGHLVGNSKVGQFALEEALSDTELRFKPPRKDDEMDVDALNENADYKITPHIDHNEMFGRVDEALANGKCIGIFPEGGSHDRTELLPLKVGVAIMALRALSSGTPVKLIPVGINYFAPHVFRSKVFVDVGRPVDIEPELVKLFNDKQTRREACSQLLETMRDRLEMVCITAPDFEALKVIRTCRRLYQGKVNLSVKEYLDLNLRFVSAYRLFGERPEFKKLAEDVHDYLERVRSHNLKDRQVRDLPALGSLRSLANTCRDVCFTILLTLGVFPAVIPGLILNLPVFLLIRHRTPREMQRQKNASSVKLKGRDVAASYQIMLGIKLLPVLHIVYSFAWIVFFVMTWPYYKRDPDSWLFTFAYNAYWFLPACFLFLGPWYSFQFCPWIGEIVWRRWRLFPRYLLCIKSFFAKDHRGSGEALCAERHALSQRVRKLVEQFIDQCPQEWDQERIIHRAKLMKQRSKSLRDIALGRSDSSSELPRRPSFQDVGDV